MPSLKQRKVAIVGSRSVGTSKTTTKRSRTMSDVCFIPSLYPLRHYCSIMANVGVPGKSSLAVQFVDGHFVESYYPTIENTFSKTIQWKGQDFSTEIVDTAGQVGPGFTGVRYAVVATQRLQALRNTG
jgi:hypothetical protein